jgi:hypothetical protein
LISELKHASRLNKLNWVNSTITNVSNLGEA